MISHSIVDAAESNGCSNVAAADPSSNGVSKAAAAAAADPSISNGAAVNPSSDSKDSLPSIQYKRPSRELLKMLRTYPPDSDVIYFDRVEQLNLPRPHEILDIGRSYYTTDEMVGEHFIVILDRMNNNPFGLDAYQGEEKLGSIIW